MSAPSYKTHDPKGWCGDPKRGAAMGRGSKHAPDTSAEIKFYLRQVRLDSGGYDVNGTYFGHGGTLYWYADAEGKVDATLRANSRAEAIAEIRIEYPRAKFFGEPSLRDGLCSTCRVKFHETCSLTKGCSCCDDTMENA